MRSHIHSAQAQRAVVRQQVKVGSLTQLTPTAPSKTQLWMRVRIILSLFTLRVSQSLPRATRTCSKESTRSNESTRASFLVFRDCACAQGCRGTGISGCALCTATMFACLLVCLFACLFVFGRTRGGGLAHACICRHYCGSMSLDGIALALKPSLGAVKAMECQYWRVREWCHERIPIMEKNIFSPCNGSSQEIIFCPSVCRSVRPSTVHCTLSMFTILFL